MYEELIKEYLLIQKSDKEFEDTIFDICGFPHYEKVASNVLAFFIDSKREHGLTTLFIDSLLKLIKVNDFIFEGDFKVEREVITSKRNFIDLLIYDDEKAIYIENKIFAGLSNDLDDYFNLAILGRKKAIGIVLSFSDIDFGGRNAKNILWGDLCEEIKNNYGQYVHNKKLNYLSFMFDFIRNIEELSDGGIGMDNDFVAFLKNNHDAVSKLGADIKKFHDDLRDYVNKINNIVIVKNTINGLKQWAWRELPAFNDVCVSDIKLTNGIGLALNSIISVDGWSFDVFIRTNQTNSKFNLYDYCAERFDGKLNNPGRYSLSSKLEFDTKPEIVADKILEILKKISA